MHNDRLHYCSLQLLFLFVTLIILVCICASSVQSVQSIGGGDETYFISTIAGTGKGALKVNVPALEATFDAISSIAQSTNGDLYVTAHGSHVVLKFEFNSTEGTWTNVTIIAGTGSLGTGADDVLGTESALNSPTGLSLIENSSGEVTAVLIVDYNNHRIRKLDMSTQIITTIAGAGRRGFSGDGGPAKDAQFYFPRHVYYDKSNGDIYIVDASNKRIRRVSGGKISTVVGKTCTGSDGLGDGGPAVDACLSVPQQFTMNNAGEWFIVDSGNNRIRKVYLNGTITTIAGGGTEIGDAPATSVQLNRPRMVAFILYGELLVADEQGGVFRKMDSSGFMKVIAGGGSGSLSYDNPIPAKSASIKPVVVTYARDGSDAIFMSDNSGFIFKLFMFECFGMKGNKACSGHGSCIGPDECKCDNGWMQVDCSITHCFSVSSNLPDRVCSGKGKCIRPNKCHCRDGFGGHKCHRNH